MLGTYFDPGLLWLDDDPDPDPDEPVEILTVAADGTVWWSAPTATDDSEDAPF